MQCPNCKETIQDGADVCPHCNYKLSVTVLSQQERDSFHGVTIDDNSHAGHDQYSGYETGGSPKIKQFNFSFGSSNWLGNLVVAAILAEILFFFLPILMFVLLVVGAAAAVFWILRGLMK
jgi:predicted amidophosphoribosyltransferase